MPDMYPVGERGPIIKKTRHFAIDPHQYKDYTDFAAALSLVAKELSILTGKKIRFCTTERDGPTWGDCGWFYIEDPVPHITINRRVTDYGLEGDIVPVESPPP